MEQRMMVSYSFKFDPAKINLGQFEFPETVIRTITAGDRIIPEKVRIEDVPGDALQVLQAEADCLILEAHKTATALPPSTQPKSSVPSIPAEPSKVVSPATPVTPAAPTVTTQGNTLSLF